MGHILKFRAWHNGEMYYEGFQRFLGSYGVQFAQFDVAPDSLMRFTGFEHKGVQIYDKDILRFTNPAPGKKWQKSHGDKNYMDMVVSWNAKRGQWCVYWQNAAGELCWSSLAKALTDDHEITGNVYENKELVT